MGCIVSAWSAPLGRGWHLFGRSEALSSVQQIKDGCVASESAKQLIRLLARRFLTFFAGAMTSGASSDRANFPQLTARPSESGEDLLHAHTLHL